MGTFKTLLSNIGDDLKKVASPPRKKWNSHLIQKVVYTIQVKYQLKFSKWMNEIISLINPNFP